MIDFFKQLIDAAGDRIRSPFLGSIAAVFVGCNWRALFYLIFANKPVRSRILYFDANTDLYSLLIYPVSFGLITALLMPWIAVVGAWIAQSPKAKLHSVQHGAASKRRITEYQTKSAEEEALAELEAKQDERRIQAQERKAEEEEANARFEAAEEHRKINAAKRLEEAKGVSVEVSDDLVAEREALDEVIQKALSTSNDEKQFHRWRNSFELSLMLSTMQSSLDGMISLSKLSDRSPNYGLLKLAGFEYIAETHKDFISFHSALVELKDAGALRAIDSQEFQITKYGYDLSEQFTLLFPETVKKTD
jgi:hypothetical protein